mmetsp:Transcript_112506/g.195237  ORF Transcript_112506/g.195237 Transcript_112506/m.195237 type:complete len:1491 (+) Transcript_112506:137-4609(+)
MQAADGAQEQHQYRSSLVPSRKSSKQASGKRKTLDSTLEALEEEEASSNGAQDLQAGLSLQSGVSEEDVQRATGYFIDFVQRMPQMDGDSAASSILSLDESSASDGAAVLLAKYMDADWPAFKEAVNIMHLEMLMFGLVEDITIFWKSKKNPAWMINRGTFKKLALETVKNVQQSRCLNCEVENWLMRHKLLHAFVPDDEPIEAKHGRVQSFWAQFHEGSRRQELWSTTPPYKDDLRKRLHRDNMREWPMEKPPESPELVSSKKKKSLRPVRSIRNATGGPSKHDLEWKQRSIRSKCSAGTWDWNRGTPKLGSRPQSTSRRKPEHWTTSLFALDNDELNDFVDALEGKEEDSDFDEEEEYLEDSFSRTSRPTSPSEPGLYRVTTLVRTAMSMPNLHNRLPTPQRFRPDSPLRPGSPVKFPDISSMTTLKPDTLPPIHHAFDVPWDRKSPTPVLKCEDTPTKRYLRACQNAKSIPRALPLVTGHSMRLKAAGMALQDKDLLAVAVTLEDLDIEEVDLEGNRSLTEKSMLKFTQALCKQPASTSLKWLSFKRCLNAGKAVLGTVIKMVSSREGVVNLRHLDLTDVAMGMQHHLPFARAIRDHRQLKTLHLCNTGLGAGMDPQQCIGDIMSSGSVEVLDLSWNCFTPEVFSHIGEKQVEMQKVVKLSLSNCSAAPKPGYASPCVYFAEHLARDQKLKQLDISLNQMDFRAALVLEDALQYVKRLTELNVSYNTLGVVGMRSLLRLLSRDTSGLIHFKCEECCSGKSSDNVEGLQQFSNTSPGGRYVLDLERPYHRSILRMLYKTCDRFNLPPMEAFSSVVSSISGFSHAQKDYHGVWSVPTEGKIQVVFSVDKAIQDAMKDMDMYAFGEYLDRYQKLMRLKPGFRKVIPLFAQWKSIDGHILEQYVMLDAMAQDFLFTYPHVQQFCQTRAIALDVICRMLDCVDGGVGMRYMTMGLLRNIPDFTRMLKSCQPLTTFNCENPNAKYTLDLGKHAERAVAEKLLLLDRWESNMAQRKNLMDTSQRGNYSVIRNEKYQHRLLSPVVHALCEWQLPDHDILEFDYSSCKRPPLKVTPIDTVTFQNILVTLQQSHCTPVEQLMALRMASHFFYVTAVQMRAFFGVYTEEEVHGEIIVISFTRVIDMYNEKVFRVRIENQTLLDELRSRLGYIAVFPFIQPEQATLELDFAFYDQRMTANLLMNISKNETPFNLKNPKYVRPDGTVDPLPLGVPRSWEVYDKMPKGGQFTVSYICAPEDRSFKARKQLFEDYGHWKMDVEEEEVMWWASLSEAPEDVLEYLEFLITKYDDMEQAFKAIDGEDGNGQITLREFEEGYQEMGCKKFAGKDESKRVEHVFRYLDPSGEGQVSKDEFMVLQLLFKEIVLSIKEFVEFCERTFSEDLADTWRFLDDDGSGSIDEQEWTEACRKIGYCGPVSSIFNYLDKDDEGTVSLDEFEELSKFQVKKDLTDEASEEDKRRESCRPRASFDRQDQSFQKTLA